MTTNEIGSSTLRLCSTVATGNSTSITSSPAYAVDEIASLANTARAMTFTSRWCPSSEVAIGLPTRTRLKMDAKSASDEQLAHRVFAVRCHEHEDLVTFEQRRIASRDHHVVLSQDGDDGGVAREPELDYLLVGRRRAGRKGHLDESRSTSLEAEQPHETADRHRLLDQRSQEVRRRDRYVDAPHLVEHPLVLPVVDASDDTGHGQLLLGEQRDDEVVLVVTRDRGHDIGLVDVGPRELRDLTAVGDQPRHARRL